MPKGTIELHTDLLSAWEALHDAEWGRLVRAMLVYRLSGETAELAGRREAEDRPEGPGGAAETGEDQSAGLPLQGGRSAM